jgi:putative ABC transport system permease protein
MTSLGMDRSKRRNLLFSESLMSVVFSILISIPFTILLSGMMTAFTIFIGLPMVIEFTWVEIPKYALIITAIILVASVSSMMKSKKLSVVQELKYE